MINFEMYTDEGNQACTEALENIKNFINGDKFISEREFEDAAESEMKKVSSTHPEVYDTEPRWHFTRLINKMLEEKGMVTEQIFKTKDSGGRSGRLLFSSIRV